MIFLHDDPGYSGAVGRVAEALLLPRAQVEKDYFITHVLWALQQSGVDLWFKGGTCLSKGYGIISRFSEDLDLMIGSGSAPSLPASPNWRGDKVGHVLGRREWFRSLAESMAIPGCSAAINPAYADERERSVVIDVRYPGGFIAELGPAIRPWIRLEVGAARVTPNLERPITSWLHDYAATVGALEGLVDNRPTVRCIHPLVTLLEKLDAMMRRWDRPDLDPLTFVRHWEDAAAVILALPSLPPGPSSAGELVSEMLVARELRARPVADHPAFALLPGWRTEALVAGYHGIRGMFFRPEQRLSLEEAARLIREWITLELG